MDNATIELLGRILYFLLADRNLVTEIIVGHDTRDSGPRIQDAIWRGFSGAGGVVQDAGVLPTPALAYLAKAQQKCALSITASHNAYPDNGIKIFGPDGFKMSERTETEIEIYLLGEKPFTRESELVTRVEIQSMHEFYRSRYCRHLTDDLFPDLNLQGLRIAVDCANGALFEVPPLVLRKLGAEVVCFNAEPDGKNINDHCGSLYPDFLLAELQKDHYDCGFSFDGDGDRCLAADCDAIYDGDHILGAAARYLQSLGRLKKNAVVATSMSNLGLEIFLRNLGITLHRVPVGDKYVLEKLQQEDFSLGGEQSGHIIFMNDSFIGDGLITALQLLRIYKSLGLPFGRIWDGFRRFPQVLLNIRVKKKPDLESIPEIRSKKESIERQLGASGRIVLRYSGTEMLTRIMIEGPDQNEIESMAHDLGEVIRNQLN